MKNLTTFEKIVIGLLAAFQGGIFLLILIPELLGLLSSTAFASDFSNNELAMVGLTGAIVFFAAVQLVLQWNQHQFDRNAQQATYNLALYDRRSTIYFKLIDCLLAYCESLPSRRDAVMDLAEYFVQNQFFLPIEHQNYVNEVLGNCRALEEAWATLSMIGPRVRIWKTLSDVEKERLKEAELLAASLPDWFAEQEKSNKYVEKFASLLRFDLEL